MPTGFIAVSGYNVTDAEGQPLADGQLCVQLTNADGKAISVRPGNNGVIITKPVCTAVTNGVFTINLPDGYLSKPQNPCGKLTVIDPNTGEVIVDTGYRCIQPSSDLSNSIVATWCTTSSGVTTCNLDNRAPDIGRWLSCKQGHKGRKVTRAIREIKATQVQQRSQDRLVTSMFPAL